MPPVMGLFVADSTLVAASARLAEGLVRTVTITAAFVDHPFGTKVGASEELPLGEVQLLRGPSRYAGL